MGMGPGFRAVATPPPSTHPVYPDMLHTSHSTGALPPTPWKSPTLASSSRALSNLTQGCSGARA